MVRSALIAAIVFSAIVANVRTARTPSPTPPVLDLTDLQIRLIVHERITGIFITSGPPGDRQLPFRAYWFPRNQRFELIVGTFPGKPNVNVFGASFDPKTFESSWNFWYPVSAGRFAETPLSQVKRFFCWPWFRLI